jgi:hypothetical protein
MLHSLFFYAVVNSLQIVLTRSKEQREAIQAALKQAKEPEGMNSGKPPIVLSSRRIKRFRDKPEKNTDPTIQEWVADIRNQAAAKKLEQAEYWAFILDHLGGKTRQEITGRGSTLEGKPEETLGVLLQVFGDGYSLCDKYLNSRLWDIGCLPVWFMAACIINTDAIS